MKTFSRRLFLTLITLLAATVGQQASAQMGLPPPPPQITSASPATGAPGAVITVTGRNLNRDRLGNVWATTPTVTPPYVIQFRTSTGQFVNATFTYVSPAQLRVTVPAAAITGRIRLSQSPYVSSTLSDFVVTAPPPPAGQGRLNIVNGSQYNLVSIKVNNVEQLQAGFVLPVRQTGTLDLNPGSYNVQVSLGITPSEGSLFFFTQRFTITRGRTSTFNVPRVTLRQLMTNFRTSGDWASDILFDANLTPYLRTVRMMNNGNYQVRETRSGRTTVVESSTYAETSWPDNSRSLSFRLGQRQVNLFLPFASFISTVGRNGQSIVVTRQ